MVRAFAPLRGMMREGKEVGVDIGMIRKKKEKKEKEKEKKKKKRRRRRSKNKQPPKPPRTAQSPAPNLTQEGQVDLNRKMKEEAQTITHQTLSTLPPLPNGQPLNAQARAQLEAPLFNAILRVLGKQQDRESRDRGIQSIVPTLLVPVKGGKGPDFERYEDKVDGCPLGHVDKGSLVEDKTELGDEACTEKDPSPLVRHKDGIIPLSQEAADISTRFLSFLLPLMLSHPHGQLVHLKTRDDVEKAIYKAAKVVLRLYKDKDVGQLSLVPVLVLPMRDGMDIQGKWVSSLGEWGDKPGDVVVSVRCE
ncbi:hypothetical protein I350_05013 [Cryptococcus amylolentus CBS 6273]|uniref:Uncharacterized protein n=1 Tax=Cryptococcus amylolentus CBS 6273 TaxID=1296118 RepID=A0A1E3K188_9TREE|nr:hypothetical protein I350_05013 [Cryptococcus amylolentus CBS 6273]